MTKFKVTGWANIEIPVEETIEAADPETALELAHLVLGIGSEDECYLEIEKLYPDRPEQDTVNNRQSKEDHC